MAQILCESCGWQGDLDDLAVEYHLNPKEPGDVIPEGICPECGNPNLRDIDNEISTEIPI